MRTNQGIAWAVGCALVLTGCAASGPVRVYDGPPRPAAEVAVIAAPEQIQIMAIDGREPPVGFLQSSVELALLPGEHVLGLRYVQLFRINADEHDVVRSSQAALRFTAAPGARYRLEIPPQPNHDAARQFAKAPQFRLVGDSSVVESVPIKSFAEASLVDTISKAFEAQGEPARPVTNADLLKDVWSRSSEQERAAFRSWLEQQEKNNP